MMTPVRATRERVERTSMNIRVRLFALLRDRAGASQVALELPSGATVAAASQALGEKLPALSPLLPRVAFAVNREYVAADTTLNDGDELAIIPPVSGGRGER